MSSGLSNIAETSEHFYTYVESGVNGVITFIDESWNNVNNQSIECIVVDSVFNAIPLRTFSKTFSEYPYRLGGMLKKVSNDADNYVKDMFKMLDKYDEELKIFAEGTSKTLKACIFVTVNTFDSTINVLFKNYVGSIFKQIFDTKNSEILSEMNNFGFSFESKDSSYLRGV